MLAALVVAVALFFVARGREGLTAPQLPLFDFVEYWAAGQLLAEGRNPYDLAAVHEKEIAAGHKEAPIPMLNPPWTLPFVLPFGWLSVRTAHLLWLVWHLFSVVLSAELLWRYYRGDAGQRWLAPILALLFIPTVVALIVGQISPLMLLGVAAFLPLIDKRRDFAAGAATTLMAIKPHMSYLFWVALLVWAIRERRWRVLLGGAITGVVLVAIAMVFRPAILPDYAHSFTQKPPERFAPPTFGYLLRLALNSNWFAWQYVPLLPGLGWLAWYGWLRRRDWNWGLQMPMLLLVSALTAAYGAWLFDLVILLVAILDLAAHLSRTGSPKVRLASVALYLLIGGGALTMLLIPGEVEYLHYVWITPAILVSYVVLMRQLRRGGEQGAQSHDLLT
jgi:hypothetical protein